MVRGVERDQAAIGVVSTDIAPDCSHCRDTRIINHPRLGYIRCPKCTRRAPRLDPTVFEELTREESARKEQEAVDRGEATKVTGLDWTICKLCEWGRWVRDKGIGYPRMSSHEKMRVGNGGVPGQNPTDYPPDIEVIDRAVSESPIDYKTILVEHYTKNGYVAEKAAHLGISRQTYYQRKASAERHVANSIGV
jgi:hypothetical protein